MITSQVLSLVFLCYFIFTARKRSLRRLCFYTCLSVILFTGGMSASVHDGIPWKQTPLRSRPPWEADPHGNRHHPPPLREADPPRKQTPPGSRHPPGKQILPVQCMLGDTGNKRAVRILLEYILVLP